jgi:hypothetical protein
MTAAGNNITKANITEAMAAVKLTYCAGIGWGTNAQPFQTDITGGSTGGYTFDMPADISDTNVTASTIINNFRSYANLLSRIRNVRLIKYYQQQGNQRARTDFDQTTVTNLNANYAWPRADIDAGGIGVGGEANINVAQLNRFVTYLSDNISAYRNNTVTVEEFYCHSNCHGSCHGSI